MTDRNFNFSHFVYNSQGRCLAGLFLDEDARPDEVVAAYLERSGGHRAYETVIEDGKFACFGETLRGRTYNRYAVRSFEQEWEDR